MLRLHGNRDNPRTLWHSARGWPLPSATPAKAKPALVRGQE
jgi:hypothetical protein